MDQGSIGQVFLPKRYCPKATERSVGLPLAHQPDEERREKNRQERLRSIEAEEDREQQRDDDVAHLITRQLLG